MRALFAESLELFGAGEKRCFLVSAATPHARGELNLFDRVVCDDLLHVDHFPDDGSGLVFYREQLVIVNAVLCYFGAGICDDIAFLNFDGICS